jgi:hypothetical protein
MASESIPEQKFIAKTTLEPGILLPIKNIALLGVPNPRYYWVRVAKTTAGKDTEVYGDFNFAVIAQRSLMEHLEAKGYQVNVSSVSRHNRYELIDDYQSLNIPDADAFLDVAPVEVGFKPNPWRPFSEVGPHVSLVVRLVSADSRRVLYAESAQYGYDKNPFATGIKIDSPPDHKFKNVAALKADRQKAIEQLMVGIDAISSAIAEKLTH